MKVEVAVRQMRLVEAKYEYEFSDEMDEKEAMKVAQARAMQQARAHKGDKDDPAAPYWQEVLRDDPEWYETKIGNKASFPFPRLGE